jgi:hypothetical protein
LPAKTDSIDRPLICVIIDTEEDFDWTGPFSKRNIKVDSLTGIPRGHEIFRRFSVQPTYLVDYPVISDPRAAELLGPWLEANECLVGAQLHPWVNPPFEEVVCPLHSYPCNLEPELEARKIAELTFRIQEVLRISPQIYKAGRYGLDIQRESNLRKLGYTVDTSVLPYRDSSGIAGGPDFFGFPDWPFWTDPDREFLYLPVTQSLIGPLRPFMSVGRARALFGRMASRLHIPGLLSRMGLLERIMLTPEGVSGTDLRRLTRALLRGGHRVFAFSLHSPSLVPGMTPYVRNEQELMQFFARIEEFLEFFFRELSGEAINPAALRERLRGGSEVVLKSDRPSRPF